MEDIKANAEVLAEDEDESSVEQKAYDAEYVKKLKAEAKEYRQAKAALKKEYEETKAKLEALEAEKLTETEKDKKRIAELEKTLNDITNSIKQKEIDNLVLKATVGKNFVDIETATLLIKKELENEEEINEQIVSKVIDNLIKSKPFLVSQSSVNPSEGNFAKQNTEPAQDLKKMWEKFLRP